MKDRLRMRHYITCLFFLVCYLPSILLADCLNGNFKTPIGKANQALLADWILAGIVTSVKGEPLPGVSVIIKGTTQGTITGVDGSFTLRTPEQVGTIVFSFVGYIAQEKSFSGSGQLNTILAEDVKALGEVVVVGYGTQKKSDITGAVAVVNVSEMNKQPTPLVTNQLQGQVSGVNILSSGQPGENPLVTIRGFNTFGTNAPLFVVDGVPIQSISNLNPNDIASIQVLKDAGAASIYGSRASNGVLIITTKKGTGKVKVQYDGFYGTQLPKQGNVWHLLNPQDMANLKWKVLECVGELYFVMRSNALEHQLNVC